ncbi:hypothetical protein HU200_008978 [Digitaria exilis]|uniref:TAZ-type domain-containing protein n=1 Tax=Digitaria exilis TaxID=1010633 RepID=A0A835FMU5_9POAL|nr:hypothetical protein HU200_008978 [Digitaria exilis]
MMNYPPLIGFSAICPVNPVADDQIKAAASPVLEQMIVDSGVVRVLGASSAAVAAFLRFLYRCPDDPMEEEEEEALLALAHAYRVPWLKRLAEASVAARLNAERAVDAMKLAALCDAPRLYMACARLAARTSLPSRRPRGGGSLAAMTSRSSSSCSSSSTTPTRKERWERVPASQHVYRQLSDAMALLDRIFFDAGEEACAEASPPCELDGGVRRGLEQLMRHFAACGRRTRKPVAACPRCRRAFQLLRLHASVCDLAGGEQCRFPCAVIVVGHITINVHAAFTKTICSKPEGFFSSCSSNLKAKMQEEGVDKTWKLLVKKVIRARVMSALANREVPEVVKKSWAKYNSRRTARFR